MGHPGHGPDLHIAAALLEIVGGWMFMVGLFTSPVAFILSGEMAVAYFLVHARQSFWPIYNQGDAAVLYCFLFLLFVFSDPGRWSLDEVLSSRRSRKGDAGHYEIAP